MHVTAKLSGYRQAPRKVRLVANLVKGKSVEHALLELNHRAKRAAPVFAKLINSAVANAKVAGLDIKTLTVGEIRVDKGRVLKRSRPRAQGRAFSIHKHTSHIMVTLVDAVAKKAEDKKVKEEKAAAKKIPKTTATAITKKTAVTKKTAAKAQ
jgi:large subunit ribosomal protein L22